jgi:hypothetical protein
VAGLEPVLLLNVESTSEVSVEFLPAECEDGGCTVRFAHGGWTEANVGARKKFGGWPVMLDRFAALADRSAVEPSALRQAGTISSSSSSVK